MFYQPVVLVNLPGKSGIAHEFHLPMAPWPRPWGRWGCQWRPNSWKVSSSLAQWIEMWGKLLPQFPVRGGLWFKNYDVYNEHVDYIYTSTWLRLDISKIMFELFCCFNKGVLKPTNIIGSTTLYELATCSIGWEESLQWRQALISSHHFWRVIDIGANIQ